MYDDKDSEERRCDNCKNKEHKDGKCSPCYTNHIRFTKGQRLPLWEQEEEDESTD